MYILTITIIDLTIGNWLTHPTYKDEYGPFANAAACSYAVTQIQKDLLESDPEYRIQSDSDVAGRNSVIRNNSVKVVASCSYRWQ